MTKMINENQSVSFMINISIFIGAFAIASGIDYNDNKQIIMGTILTIFGFMFSWYKNKRK